MTAGSILLITRKKKYLAGDGAFASSESLSCLLCCVTVAFFVCVCCWCLSSPDDFCLADVGLGDLLAAALWCLLFLLSLSDFFLLKKTNLF